MNFIFFVAFQSIWNRASRGDEQNGWISVQVSYQHLFFKLQGIRFLILQRKETTINKFFRKYLTVVAVNHTALLNPVVPDLNFL